MAYELRRVPPGWSHPKDALGRYVPLYGEPFDRALRRWEQAPVTSRPVKCDLEAPVRGTFVPFGEAEATHYQVYEDTTEGTPLSPIFATKDGVIAWLLIQAIAAEDARAFVELGHVPAEVTLSDGTVLCGFATAALILNKQAQWKASRA
jgi:hypothetical protein